MSERHENHGSLIGAPVPRVEDRRFVSGRGQYVDDIKAPGTAHAAFVRSPYAHARVVRIDGSGALALPGVVAVFTAKDLSGILRPIRVESPIKAERATVHTALAEDRVRLVGDLVAMVIAENRYIAEDAADLIDVEYDPLPPVPDYQTALNPGSVPLFEELGTNVIYDETFDYGDVADAFRSADLVLQETFQQHRYTNVPLETRGGLAIYDGATTELTYYTGTRSPHAMRVYLAQQLHMPSHRVRVIAPDMGGAFGQKYGVYREDMLVAMAAMRTRRPAKWIEDRRESLTAGGHAREETIEVEAAVRKDGTIIGVRARMIIDVGAYPILPRPPGLFTATVRVLLPAPYRFQHYRFRATAVLTNKAPYIPYRGPWVIESWIREGLADLIARKLGMNSVDVRRRNIVRTDEQPYRIASGITLNNLDVRAVLDRAVERANIPRFREEQRRAHTEGRLLGFGLAVCVEPSPGSRDFLTLMDFGADAPEVATVRLEPTGHVTLITAQSPHGQGHETTLAQVVASELGLPLEHVRVLHGDTNISPFRFLGTGGSRSATFASGAALYATRELRDRIIEAAALALGRAPADLEVRDGAISTTEDARARLSLEELARLVYLTPYKLPPGAPAELSATYAYDGGEGGFAAMAHCCWVEVDRDTGKVAVTRYLVVEDCGRIINPTIVDGQVRGGVAQGIGGVLYEHAVYDENAQFLTATLMDYLLPTAVEVPNVEIEHIESRSADPVHFRGVGEGGTIGAVPAVANAISDALGITVTRQPVTPTRVLQWLGAIPAEE